MQWKYKTIFVSLVWLCTGANQSELIGTNWLHNNNSRRAKGNAKMQMQPLLIYYNLFQTSITPNLYIIFFAYLMLYSIFFHTCMIIKTALFAESPGNPFICYICPGWLGLSVYPTLPPTWQIWKSKKLDGGVFGDRGIGGSGYCGILGIWRSEN